MKDRVMELIIAHSKKYGASYEKPRPTLIYKCPTRGIKHHATTKPKWVK